MKKWIAWLLALVMCLVLCACGGGAHDAQSSESASPEKTDAAEKTQEDADAEPQHIELNIPVGSRFTIVEATCSTERSAEDEVMVRLKIQNNTDEDFECVDFQFYSYDKNGDKVGEHNLGVDDMEAGHATWTSDIYTDLTMDEFGSVKIDNYEIMRWIDDSTMEPVEKETLNPKPEIPVEQMSAE